MDAIKPALLNLFLYFFSLQCFLSALMTSLFEPTISELTPTVLISELRLYPQFLSVIAGWFHSQRTLGGFVGTLAECERKLAAQFESDDIPVTYVALIDGQAVGAASLVYYEFTNKDVVRVPWLTNVFVEPRFRELGLGNELVAFMERRAAEMEHEQVNLFTVDKRGFYERRGWNFEYKARLSARDVDVMSFGLGDG